jgi:hypothetical protein
MDQDELLEVAAEIAADFVQLYDEDAMAVLAAAMREINPEIDMDDLLRVVR